YRYRNASDSSGRFHRLAAGRTGNGAPDRQHRNDRAEIPRGQHAGIPRDLRLSRLGQIPRRRTRAQRRWKRERLPPHRPARIEHRLLGRRVMFERILIANRGEIACRIMRTCRRLGIETVAVFSEADADAQHVRQADVALPIGGPRPADSYLRGDAIIEAAKKSGAQAIHPGYGFLSENADFVDAVERAGLVFIGPSSESMREMGSKAGAKDLMASHGVPVVPGYTGADQ